MDKVNLEWSAVVCGKRLSKGHQTGKGHSAMRMLWSDRGFSVNLGIWSTSIWVQGNQIESYL